MHEKVISNWGDISDEDFLEGLSDFTVATGEGLTGLPIKTGLRIGEGFADVADGEIDTGLKKIVDLPKSVTDKN